MDNQFPLLLSQQQYMELERKSKEYKSEIIRSNLKMKRAISLLLIICIISVFASTTFASANSTAAYMGKGNNVWHHELYGNLYYSDNTTTSVDVTYMTTVVTNNDTSNYPSNITFFKFLVRGYEFESSRSPITPGNSGIYEVNLHTQYYALNQSVLSYPYSKSVQFGMGASPSSDMYWVIRNVSFPSGSTGYIKSGTQYNP